MTGSTVGAFSEDLTPSSGPYTGGSTVPTQVKMTVNASLHAFGREVRWPVRLYPRYDPTTSFGGKAVGKKTLRKFLGEVGPEKARSATARSYPPHPDGVMAGRNRARFEVDGNTRLDKPNRGMPP